MWDSFRRRLVIALGRRSSISVWGAALVAVLAVDAFAFEGRLLHADGRPAADCQVSVIGRPGSVRVSNAGDFRLDSMPRPPFILIATGPSGEIYPPIEVLAVPADEKLELRLAELLREEITVAAGVAPSVTASPAAATFTIGGEELERNRPTRIADALTGIAGVGRSEDATTSVPVIRGLGRGRTAILLDGARVTAERRAGASATFVDPFSLASIEVARGPGSVAYGSDAFGGVVSARPTDPLPEGAGFRYDLQSGFGASDEMSAGVEGTFAVGSGAMLIQGRIREAGNNENADGDEIHNSGYRDRGTQLRYRTETPLGVLRAGWAWDYGADIGKPAASSLATRTYYAEEDSRRLTLALDAHPPKGWNSLSFLLAADSYELVTNRHRYANANTTDRFESADVSSCDVQLRSVGSRGLAGGKLDIGLDMTARFGLEATNLRVDHDASGTETGRLFEQAIEDATKIDAALFVTYDLPLGSAVLFSSGARVDRVEVENSGGYFGDRSRSDTAFSGQLAISIGPFSGVTGTLQVARGFREPTLSDRYFRGVSGRGFVIGNPDLEPETSLQYDASLVWAGPRASAGLYGYHYRIDDLVERYRAGDDFRFRNRGEAEVRGAELEGTVQLPKGFSFGFGLATAKGEILDDDTPLTDISPPLAHLSLRWSGARGSASIRCSVYDHDDRPGSTELERSGYTTLDASLSWRFFDGLELRVVGRNLTDRDYFDSADADSQVAAGRSTSVGVMGRF